MREPRVSIGMVNLLQDWFSSAHRTRRSALIASLPWNLASQLQYQRTSEPFAHELPRKEETSWHPQGTGSRPTSARRLAQPTMKAPLKPTAPARVARARQRLAVHSSFADAAQKESCKASPARPQSAPSQRVTSPRQETARVPQTRKVDKKQGTPCGDLEELILGPDGPSRATISVVFNILQHDGEVHSDALLRALELAGVHFPNFAWKDEILQHMNAFTTLDLLEFLDFFDRYWQRQQEEIQSAFTSSDIRGTGFVDLLEVARLMENFGVTPMPQVVQEIAAELDGDRSGHLSVTEFREAMRLMGSRQGFSKRELSRLMAAFHLHDASGRGQLTRAELAAVLSYLHYSLTFEEAQGFAMEADITGTGKYSRPEFLLFMRKVRETELARIQTILHAIQEGSFVSRSKEDMLLELLRSLKYFPDKKAVEDAAADAGLKLSWDGLGHVQYKGGMKFSLISDVARNPEAVRSRRGRSAEPPLTLGEAWQFLEVYRSREGFTRDECEDVNMAFRTFMFPMECESGGRISYLDCYRAVKWLGFQVPHHIMGLLLHEVDVEDSGAIDGVAFLQLVRKIRETELDEVQAQLRATVAEQLPNAKHAGEDGRDDFSLISEIMCQRTEQRRLAWGNAGFSQSEAEGLTQQFHEHFDEELGRIPSPALQILAQDAFPDAGPDWRHWAPGMRGVVQKGLQMARMNCHEFLLFMRRLHDVVLQEHLAKENRAADQANLTTAQLRGFREIFISIDRQGAGIVSFEAVKEVLSRVVTINDKRTQQLWHLCTQLTTDGQVHAIDFADFIRILHHLLELDFAGLKAKTAHFGKEKDGGEMTAGNPPPEDSSVPAKETHKGYVARRRSIQTSAQEVDWSPLSP